jgi:hypothetical protein
MLRRLRCHLGLHSWQAMRNPEGGWYRECQACRKQGGVRTSGGTWAGGT